MDIMLSLTEHSSHMWTQWKPQKSINSFLILRLINLAGLCLPLGWNLISVIFGPVGETLKWLLSIPLSGNDRRHVCSDTILAGQGSSEPVAPRIYYLLTSRYFSFIWKLTLKPATMYEHSSKICKNACFIPLTAFTSCFTLVWFHNKSDKLNLDAVNMCRANF
jgi:hypothetical protein